MACLSTILLVSIVRQKIFVGAVYKDYQKDGNDWTEKTCNAENNPTVSPININTNTAICTSDYLMDIYFFATDERPFRLGFVGQPKTLKTRFAVDMFDMFVRFADGSYTKYRAKDLVVRVPSEHTIDRKRAPAEQQYTFVVDRLYKVFGSPPEIQLSIMNTLVQNKTRHGFFSKLIQKLEATPIDKMLLASEITPIKYYTSGPSSLNTYYQRPIKFWMYNGTSTDGDCSKKIIRIIIKQPRELSFHELDFYHSYLKNLTGYENNARQVINPNNIAVHSCGSNCENLIWEFIQFVAIYAAILYFTFAIN